MSINNGLRALLRAAGVAGCIFLLACGGGASINLESLPGIQQGDNVPPAADVLPVDGPEQQDSTSPIADSTPLNKLVLNVPDISEMGPGAEFDVSLSGVFASELYQGSMRLLFDPQSFKPVGATRGGLLLSDMVHIASIDQDGFVPFAFTGLPGGRSMEPGAGELLRVRFRVISPDAQVSRITLQNDIEFLQLRDRNSRRIKFDFESRAGVQ